MGFEKEQLIAEIKKLQTGDGQAFERLYQMTSQSAYFTALKIVKNEDDAQDVLQESYMIVLDKINDLEKPDAFMSWFHMIVANKAKELLRKNNKYLFADPDESAGDDADAFFDSLEDETAAYSPAAGVEQEELKKQVLALIDGLSDEKRTVILLYYYNDLTIRQIAESLAVNENTVKSRLFHAKRELADGVKKYEKKHGRLLAVSPVALLLWVLRDASAATSAAFIKSGAAASTLAAVQTGASAAQTAAAASAGGAAATGGTAAAGSAAAATGSAAAAGGGAAAKIIGMTVVQKVIAGAVATAVIGGSAVGVKQAADRLRAPQIEETSLSVQAEAAWQEETEPTLSGRTLAAITSKGTTAPEPTATAAPESNTSVRGRETTAAGSAQTSAANTTAAAAGEKTTTARATTTKAATKAATTKAATTVRATTTAEASTAKPETTKPAVTTTKPTTTKPTTTTKPATTTEKQTTTTEKQTATVTITITQSGSYADTTTVTVDAGDTFTFSDAKSAVAAKGYDTTFAEYSGGSLPITAEAGRSYSITIDVE